MSLRSRQEVHPPCSGLPGHAGPRPHLGGQPHGREWLSSWSSLSCGPTNPCQTSSNSLGVKTGRKENNQGGERGEILKSGQHQELVSMTTAPYYSCSNCSLF